jgi:hypothetical protein
MKHNKRLTRIAAARARNLEPWGAIRTLAGGKGQPVIGTDARIRDITRAMSTDPSATGRALHRVARNDLRVVWHTFWLAMRLRYGR